jgi:hypothetical protein
MRPVYDLDSCRESGAYSDWSGLGCPCSKYVTATDTFQTLRQVDDALGRYQRTAAIKAEQLTLFADLPDDRRPIYERTTAGRYQQPSLRTLPEQQADQEKT